MLILLNKIILILSFLGMCGILIKKTPLLLELPETLSNKKEELFIEKILKKITEKLKHFSWKKFLEKFLLRIKIITLKIENYISHLIKKLRKENKEEKEVEEDNYWDKLKK